MNGERGKVMNRPIFSMYLDAVPDGGNEYFFTFDILEMEIENKLLRLLLCIDREEILARTLKVCVKAITHKYKELI